MTQKIKASLTTPTGTGLSPCIQGIVRINFCWIAIVETIKSLQEKIIVRNNNDYSAVQTNYIK